jgi:hypothetical protein
MGADRAPAPGPLPQGSKLPAQLEICTRILDGLPCLGVLYRPTPETVYCYRCGGAKPGVIYRRRGADGD